MLSPARAAAGLALAAVAMPAVPAAPGEGCAALDQLYRAAKSDFPALRGKSFDAGKCVQRRNEFRCRWSFPADTFSLAQAQVARLGQCTAAQPRAEALPAKHGAAQFQINPETVVAITGPELDSGSWAIRLKIATTADWD